MSGKQKRIKRKMFFMEDDDLLHPRSHISHVNSQKTSQLLVQKMILDSCSNKQFNHAEITNYERFKCFKTLQNKNNNQHKQIDFFSLISEINSNSPIHRNKNQSKLFGQKDEPIIKRHYPLDSQNQKQLKQSQGKQSFKKQYKERSAKKYERHINFYPKSSNQINEVRSMRSLQFNIKSEKKFKKIKRSQVDKLQLTFDIAYSQNFIQLNRVQSDKIQAKKRTQQINILNKQSQKKQLQSIKDMTKCPNCQKFNRFKTKFDCIVKDILQFYKQIKQQHKVILQTFEKLRLQNLKMVNEISNYELVHKSKNQEQIDNRTYFNQNKQRKFQYQYSQKQTKQNFRQNSIQMNTEKKQQMMIELQQFMKELNYHINDVIENQLSLHEIKDSKRNKIGKIVKNISKNTSQIYCLKDQFELKSQKQSQVYLIKQTILPQTQEQTITINGQNKYKDEFKCQFSQQNIRIKDIFNESKRTSQLSYRQNLNFLKQQQYDINNLTNFALKNGQQQQKQRIN